MKASPQALSVGLWSLGCARNLVDSEVALGSLLAKGYSLSPSVERSDIAILNTCGFTDEAKGESLEALESLIKLKKKGQVRHVVVMGCFSQRAGKRLDEDYPDIDACLGANDFGRLAEALEPLKRQTKVFTVAPKPEYLMTRYLPRQRLTPRHMAYMKISEGCINACSYCAIPLMKGKHRSRAVEDLLEEAEMLAGEGVKEINVIGQDIAAYGMDRYGRFELAKLLDAMARRVPNVWLRLLYAHPAHVTDEWVEVYMRNPNIVRYLDLPIEHSHPDMLKRMNRQSTREQIDHVIRRFRKEVPGMGIRTAVIVGFPGETEEEFENLLDYIRTVRFERLGAFRYSREEGTRAYGMEGQLSDAVKEERFHKLMMTQQVIQFEINAGWIGQTHRVLIEGPSDRKNVYSARSAWDAPEVDSTVFVHSTKPLEAGSFADVTITACQDYDLVAQV